MKTLQSNFTTPEQSNRLLELGVPTNSADMYYHTAPNQSPKYAPHVLYAGEQPYGFKGIDEFIPCWSVGRLIEIALICHESTSAHIAFDRPLYDISYCTNIDWAIRCIESAYKTGHIDFSKLEE